MNNLKLPALTAVLLLTAGALTTSQAQAVSQEDASTYFEIDAGSARTGDDIGVTTLTPGRHEIVVKSSYGGNILSSSTINVSAGSWYTVALATGESNSNYALSFESGF